MRIFLLQSTVYYNSTLSRENLRYLVLSSLSLDLEMQLKVFVPWRDLFIYLTKPNALTCIENYYKLNTYIYLTLQLCLSVFL